MKRTAGDLPSTSARIVFHNAYFKEAVSALTKGIFLGFLQTGAEVQRRFINKPEVLNSWPGETLILGSQDDQLAIRSLEEIQARFPRARTHLLPERGHHSFMLFPEAYTGALCALLEDMRAEIAGEAQGAASGGTK